MNNKKNASIITILHCIFWGALLPQVSSIAINFNGWELISGEANSGEVEVATQVLVFQLLILSFNLGLLAIYFFKRIIIGWPILLSGLVLHAAYMLFFLSNVGEAVPNNIQPWILSEGNIGRWNITLYMPAAFLSLYGLTRVTFSKLKNATANWLVFGLTIGVPVIWYLIVSISQPLWFGQLSTTITIIVTTIAVTFFLAGFIRLFDSLLHKDSSSNLVKGHYLPALLVGLVAPLGGLALNGIIPFPADFQASVVYLITVLNGLVLLLKPVEEKYSTIRLFLRFTFLPFTFYFFMVFLPFLPLSIFAIILVGLGILMLAPLALGLFQFKITVLDFKLSRDKLGFKKSIIVALLGVILMPAYFLAQAILDKQAIESTLNYFYSHDMDSSVLSDSQIERAARSLIQLRDRKAEAQLPYISGVYNSIVFGSMVLPDYKISELYQFLKDEKLPEVKSSFWGRDFRRNQGRGGVAPATDVTLANVEVIDSTRNKSSIRLTLKNNTNETHTLYSEKINIPEGVFVTGLRLKIEGKWESAQIIDKKTAIWVFKKITEVRRDPALLYYSNKEQMELRVYPFPANGIREVEVDFEYHPLINAEFLIGERKVNLNKSANSPVVVIDNGSFLGSDLLRSSAFERKPYLHFILNYSENSNSSSEQVIEKISKITEELKISKFKVSAANIGVSNLKETPIFTTERIEPAREFIDNISLKRKGAFWVQQALAKSIVAAVENVEKENVEQTPVFVVLDGSNKIRIKLDKRAPELRQWAWKIPDMNEWYLEVGGELIQYKIKNAPSSESTSTIENKKVVAVKTDEKIMYFSGSQSSLISVPEDSSLYVYSSKKKAFDMVDTIPIEFSEQNNWIRLVKIWQDWKKDSLNPSTIEEKRKEYHRLSTTNRFLLPLTSFIVVESESQREMLRRKEKQALENHSGLEFDEQQTSEPSWLLMLSLLIMYLIYINLKQRRLKLKRS